VRSQENGPCENTKVFAEMCVPGEEITRLYYAFVRVFSNGWSVGTNPNMLVDWEAPSGQKLAFPVGFQVGKVRKLGKLPVKFDAQVQYFAVRPQVYGPKWNLQFQITPILPALIGRKRRGGIPPCV
jgi:hypothetical protein